MNLVDSTMRYAIPALGVGVRWLKDELLERGVSVRITESCLRELVADADSAARFQASGLDSHESYVTRLRHEIAGRAEFVREWTRSDERIDLDGLHSEALVRIARKYALPRAWRLTDPVAMPSQHPTPTYLYWSSAH
jgi:hypothetical protein